MQSRNISVSDTCNAHNIHKSPYLSNPSNQCNRPSNQLNEGDDTYEIEVLFVVLRTQEILQRLVVVFAEKLQEAEDRLHDCD